MAGERINDPIDEPVAASPGLEAGSLAEIDGSPTPESVELSRAGRVVKFTKDLGRIVAQGDGIALVREISHHPW